MSSGNKPGLSFKVFNIYVKDHVASDLLMSDWVRVSKITNIERDLHVLRFFGDGILPKYVPIFLVEPNGLFKCIWDLDPEFAISSRCMDRG